MSQQIDPQIQQQQLNPNNQQIDIQFDQIQHQPNQLEDLNNYDSIVQDLSRQQNNEDLELLKIQIEECVKFTKKKDQIDIGILFIKSLFGLVFNIISAPEQALNIYIGLILAHDILFTMVLTSIYCVLQIDESLVKRNCAKTLQKENYNVRRSSTLSSFVIHREVLNRTSKIYWINFLTQSIYLLAFFYANINLDYILFTPKNYDEKPQVYIWGIIVLTLQYMKVILPTALLFCFFLLAPIISLIFSIFINIYNNYKEVQNKKKRIEAIKKLKCCKYASLKSQDNQECAICMIDYEENDNIIVLPCNKKHLFHQQCIIQWLEINSICPICRKDISNEEQNFIIQQQNLQEHQENIQS